MPKDRSFAHRIHQSNIDRQRNAEYFLSRPTVAAKIPQEPKVGLWQHVKNSCENHKLLWGIAAVLSVVKVVAIAAWWLL